MGHTEITFALWCAAQGHSQWHRIEFQPKFRTKRAIQNGLNRLLWVPNESKVSKAHAAKSLPFHKVIFHRFPHRNRFGSSPCSRSLRPRGNGPMRKRRAHPMRKAASANMEKQFGVDCHAKRLHSANRFDMPECVLAPPAFRIFPTFDWYFIFCVDRWHD